MAVGTQGTVEAIWLKRAVHGPMDPVTEATLVEGEGIENDANRGRSKRQVTLIEREVFDALRESLPGADPAMRRANVMVRGLPLEGSRYRVVRIGEARILIHGETKPCERMDEQCQGLTAALGPRWNGGAFGVVVQGGVVRVGDTATYEAGDDG